MRIPWSLLATVVAALVACSGASGKGLGAGSALCGVSGNNQCRRTQKCNPTIGCVECEQNSDCTQPTLPICIVGSGRCAACGSNSDCGASAPSCWPGDHRCHPSCTTGDAASVCPQGAQKCDSNGACVGCTDSSDCTGNNKICDLDIEACVACASDSDCPAGTPRCYTPMGRCVACLDNADCGGAQPICSSLDNFTCIPGCTMDSQCSGSKPTCATNWSICVPCTKNADCASRPGTVCGGGGRCVPSATCNTNKDCPSAIPVCNAGSCVECVRQTDCPAGRECNAFNTCD